MAGAGSSSRKGKEIAFELVGPRSGTFLPPDMPPMNELDGHVPWIIQCDCMVGCCYTADEAKMKSGGLGGKWGFVCGHARGPAPYFAGSRCDKDLWFEDQRQYEVYWYGEKYVQKKEAKELEEKRKREHIHHNQKAFEEWCAKKMANKQNN
uniref:Uncharacterized protein n=1 Tax=Avena sativa TaxID=4498 RepID=A0ACD5XSH3_AVESA